MKKESKKVNKTYVRLSAGNTLFFHLPKELLPSFLSWLVVLHRFYFSFKEIKMKFVEKEAFEIKSYENCFVYFLIKDDEVVYVGQTTKGASRPFSHRDKEYNKIMAINCNKDDLDYFEDFYIKKYMPKYNKAINYKMNYSLGRAKKEIQELIDSTFNLTKLKKIIKQLDIKLFENNGTLYMSVDDYLDILDYVNTVK